MIRRFFLHLFDRWRLFTGLFRDRLEFQNTERRRFESTRDEWLRREEALVATVKIRDEHIEQLISIIQRDRERVEAETAIATRQREDALSSPRFGG